jgi:hypothetical protein
VHNPGRVLVRQFLTILNRPSWATTGAREGASESKWPRSISLSLFDESVGATAFAALVGVHLDDYNVPCLTNQWERGS